MPDTDLDPISRLLPADPLARSAAPEGVWDYNNYRTWRDPVWALMADVLDARVREEFRRNPPEYVVSDDLSWLDEIIERATGRHEDIKHLTADRLARRYHSIRACHATRTADVGAFYRQGLRVLDPSHAEARAAEIFLGGDYPEVNETDLQRAIISVGSDLRAGRVWFEANEQDLIGYCGHYLLYGGEYLIALAAHLGGARDYRQVLKGFGRPTMYVCDVPLPLMGGHTLVEFAGCALEYVFENLQDEDYEPDPHRGAGFCIHRPLPPENIVGHYHPAHIRDPYLGYRVLD